MLLQNIGLSLGKSFSTSKNQTTCIQRNRYRPEKSNMTEEKSNSYFARSSIHAYIFERYQKLRYYDLMGNLIGFHGNKGYFTSGIIYLNDGLYVLFWLQV